MQTSLLSHDFLSRLDRLRLASNEPARGHLKAARETGFPRTAISALAPATLVESYLGRTARNDIFGKPIEVPQFERTACIAWSVLCGRI